MLFPKVEELKLNYFYLFIYFAGAVKFGTTATCGGQIVVDYGEKQEKVCPSTLSKEFQEKLCRNLKCGGHDSNVAISKKKQVCISLFVCSFVARSQSLVSQVL